MSDIERLIFCYLKLFLIFQRMLRRVAQERYERDKKLRPDHIHFFKLVRNVNDAVIIQIVIFFKQ